MKRVVLCLAVILLLPSFAAAFDTKDVGVVCSCDPPGTLHPPGFDCRALCAPRSGGSSQQGGGGSSYSTPSYDYDAERQHQLNVEKQLQQEIEKQRKVDEEAAALKQEEFERDKRNALNNMKGAAEGELGLKSDDNGGGLKEIGDSSVLTPQDKKKPYVKNLDIDIVKVQPGVSNPAQLRRKLLSNFPNTILNRTDQPNKQAQEILRSFKTKEPPSPIKNIADLAPGDVILVAAWPWKDRNKAGYSEVAKSIGINFMDQWGSNNWSSPASHAAIFLGERNGKRWYMDNQVKGGPVIKEEKDFLKEYGARKMDIATLVGQPLSKHEGEELWKGAHELRNTTTYWPSKVSHAGSNDPGMVCSESSRWLLMRAGRRVLETQSENAKILGIDTGLNKKQFIDFSPSDFYENEQYFVIHQLGTQRKGK